MDRVGVEWLVRLMLDHLLMKASPSENPAASAAKDADLVTNSILYKEFLAEREEILRHKWIESEKVGHDIGFEKALLDWIVRFRSSWREKRRNEHAHAA